MADTPERRPGGGGRDPGLQRVRVGVTGLAAVFLLTLLAASLFALLGPDTHSPAHQASLAAANQAAAEEAPKEPLAELGVAPGNAPKVPAPATRPVPLPPPAHAVVPAPAPANPVPARAPAP